MTSPNGDEPAATSNDPAVLAAEIEKTREDLAETLDAIAEKVSPKRVADRTKKKVAKAVSSAKDSVVEAAGSARESVSGGRAEPSTGDGATTATVPSLPPVHAVEASGVDLGATPAASSQPSRASGPSVRPEHVAGAGLGLLVLLLLRRRRARRRVPVKGRRRR